MTEFKGNTYSGWHVYLWTNHRLKTNPQPCHNCGGQATTWAHTNTCTDTRWGTTSGSGPREMAWCPHLLHYVPFCHACHRLTDANRRVGSPMKGKHHSAETRARISAKMIGNDNRHRSRQL